MHKKQWAMIYFMWMIDLAGSKKRKKELDEVRGTHLLWKRQTP